MASTIKQRNIGGLDNAIRMINSTFARPLFIRDDWSSLRIGIRYHFEDPGVNIVSPYLAVGLLAGTSNQWGDSSTSHFVGLSLAPTQFQRIFATAFRVGAGAGENVWKPVVKIGGVATLGTSLHTESSTYVATGVTSARQLIFLDITKGSPNYTFQLPFIINDSNPTPGDVTTSEAFRQYMLTANPAPPTYDTRVLNPARFPSQTLAVDEATNGTLNAVNVYWNHATVALEITDLGVRIIS